MFSIITVVKNDLDGFKCTRQSVEMQTFTNWEHIVVPASAGDSTTLFVGEMNSQGLVLRVQDGTGIYSAMNQGLASATQDFVVFLNAGDLLAGPETLALVRNALETRAAKWFVFGGTVMRAEKVVEIRPVPHPTPLSVGCGQSNMMHPSIYYRRDFIVELGGYDESFSIAGDLELNMRAVGRAAPAVVDTPTSVFFADGVSSIRVFTSLNESFRARRVLLDRKGGTVIVSFAWYLCQVIRVIVRRTIRPVWRKTLGKASFLNSWAGRPGEVTKTVS